MEDRLTIKTVAPHKGEGEAGAEVSSTWTAVR